MKTLLLAAACALGFFSATPSSAATDQRPAKQMVWPFDGMLGIVDKQAAQRGFQVYKEVCAACHGLKHVAFRNLVEIGFPENEVKALAASYTFTDGPNDAGEMFERPGIPADRFPSPFPNEQAARAANNGAYPPDLSLIVKARPDGANYLHSLLIGYEAPPEGVVAPAGMYYNPYFPGGLLAMPQPIAADGQVTYEDGTQASIDQMSRDVTVFLQWAAEPEMQARKTMGIKVLLFLAVFVAFMYLAKKRIWKRLGH